METIQDLIIKRKKPSKARFDVNCVDTPEKHNFHLDNNDNKVYCQIERVNITMLIDSGRKSNIISAKTWDI